MLNEDRPTESPAQGPVSAEAVDLDGLAQDLRDDGEWSSETPWFALSDERRARWVRFAEKVARRLEAHAAAATQKTRVAERLNDMLRVAAQAHADAITTRAEEAERELAEARAEVKRLRRGARKALACMRGEYNYRVEKKPGEGPDVTERAFDALQGANNALVAALAKPGEAADAE